jgi:hypothetical protein
MTNFFRNVFQVLSKPEPKPQTKAKSAISMQAQFNAAFNQHQPVEHVHFSGYGDSRFTWDNYVASMSKMAANRDGDEW